ncbi:alpha-tectorin-like [Dendropsophus ebraccatus]|uniref:alpha-tectorin-like n=1 Tax=Dendropsophus ebraccatus TaxID=150705 RepID=UPI003831E532
MDLVEALGFKGNVNNASFNLPLHSWESGVWIWQNGLNILLTTEFGLEVIYDLSLHTIVKLPSSFYGQVCGLCGNYNGDRADDYPHPDGSLDKDVLEETWKDGDLGTSCETHCLGHVCSTCEKSSLYEGKSFCGLLLAKEGLFSACHNHVDPLGYFTNCVFKLCRDQGDPRVLCDSLQSYVAMCQNVGITEMVWRNESFCRLDCPDHSHYDICSDSCGTTCSQMLAPAACSDRCSEGCQCNGGHYLDTTKCVPLGMCGCVVEGKYYTINESFLGDNCVKLCTCLLGGAVVCKAHQCPEETTCKRVLDRTYICAK